MFDTSHLKESTDHDAATIVDEYEDLLFADSPILFTGINKAGQRIVGSSIDFHRESRTEWNFHAVVSDEDNAAFRAREMNYPTLLRRSKLFLFGWQAKNALPLLFEISFDDIPAEYQPAETAMCPEEEIADRAHP